MQIQEVFVGFQKFLYVFAALLGFTWRKRGQRETLDKISAPGNE